MNNLHDFSSPLAQRLGLHVQNVIEQISVRLKYFLDNVNTIYESHGINFPIKQNYTNLMRMLTPFELLSKFQMIQNNQLLSSSLVQKIKQTLDAQVSVQSQNYEEYYNQNENQSIQQNDFEKYYNQQKKQTKQILQSSALSMLRGMREQKQKELNQKQRTMNKEKKEKDRGQKDQQRQKQKQKQGFNISDRIKRDSTKNYRQKGIIGKKRQNLSVIKPNTNHYMRQSIYITEGTSYMTQEMQKQLCQWATSQLLRGNQLLIQDIMSQAKYIGRSIPNLIVTQGWLARFMKKYDNLRRLFRKSKGLQKQKGGREGPSIKLSLNTSSKKAKSFSMENELKKQHQKQKQQYIYEEQQQFEQSDHRWYENEQFQQGSKNERKDYSKRQDQDFGQYQLNMGLQSKNGK